ncbi:MAG: zinc ABC transporter substrate-binding protein [Granulosicoccus sp.]
MSKHLLVGTLALLFPVFFNNGAVADVPVVVADIPPVHSLVSQVMGSLGEPHLLLKNNTSPHDHALRPSNAKAVQNAELIFWAGERLTPWLGQLAKNMGGRVKSVELIQNIATKRLSFRSTVLFDQNESKDVAGEAVDTYSGNNYDPHAWLDPGNAIIWLDVIADALASQDTENASTYHANATTGKELLKQLVKKIDAQFVTAGTTRFIVFHDAYHYFENAFGVFAKGAISLSDGIRPSVSRITKIRERLEQGLVNCVLVEPQYNKTLVSKLTGNMAIKIIVADPLGGELPQGAELYPQLIQNLADAISKCTS